MNGTRQWTAGLALYLLLGATLLLYWPGLHGPLVLDDISNLGRIKNIGPIHDSSTFFRFVFSSSTQYPSRPLSLASFLLNNLSWPVYVPVLKYTNVLIHLLNGALVFWLAWLLCSIAGVASRTVSRIALTSTALWLLAPLQVSTVLYVVQRETELSALFVLSGTIAYCYARTRLAEQPGASLAWMTAGVGVFGILGFLCKENALLLGLYILALEYTFLKTYLPVRDRGIRLLFGSWKWLVLVAPVALGFILMVMIRGLTSSYEHRSFTAFQRIVSQPRIVADYLQNLLIPVRHGMGIAHDDYVLSTGWLSPPSTMICIVALVVIVLAAVYLARRNASLFALAALWFLGGHLMESSVIPLEPYFEHRNYLPAFGPFFSLAFFIWTTRLEVARYVKIGLALYVAAFAFLTKQNVDIWSSKAAMADVWANDHPRSIRAQQLLADVWSRAGRADKTLEILRNIADLRPHAMGPQVEYFLQACRAEPARIDEYLADAKRRISKAYFDHAVIPTLITLKDSHNKTCPKLSSDELLGFVDTVLKQRSVSTRRKAVSDLLYVRATIFAAEGKPQKAVSNLYNAFKTKPSYDLGLASAEYLYNLKQYGEALKVLDDVRAIHVRPWSSDNFRAGDLQRWNDRIHAKLDAASR